MPSGRAYKTLAVILKRRNVGEADRTITMFTKEQGRITVVAKGIRRIHSRRAAHLEIFSHVRAVIRKGRTWDSVTEVVSLNEFPLLRASLPRVSAAYYLCELVDALTAQGQQQRDVYALLVRALEDLDAPTSDPTLVTEHFVHAFLRRLGYLSWDHVLPVDQIAPYVERIIEKRLRSPRIIARLSATIPL